MYLEVHGKAHMNACDRIIKGVVGTSNEGLSDLQNCAECSTSIELLEC